MFGLFADYKSPEDVLLEFAMKKLKLHYEAHSQLSSIWEDSILKDTRYLVHTSDLKDTPDLKPFYSKGVFSHADEAKEFRRAIVEGEPETLEDLESKLAQVEMMLGNRLMAQNVVEKEINLSQETKLQVKKTEAKVVGLRKILQLFPKRIAELNTTIGKGLLKRKRLIEVIDVLEVIKFTKLLGASTKREMMRLIKEQNWQELEPHRFLNIKSVKLAIQSLKVKVPQFEKEVKDDFIQLLQKPNLEGFLQLFEFLFAVSKRFPDWTAAREKFKKVFMDEMDHFFATVSSPAKYVEACVHRVTEVLFSPLKLALGLSLDEPPTPLKPKHRFATNVGIDPTTMTACITSILVNLSASMNNWNKLTKYTYLHERTLESKLTSETSHLGFLREFRESLHFHRSALVAEAITCLEKCLAVIREEQISRLNPKVLLRLRAALSRFYAECHQFSLEVPTNSLEAEYTKLIEGYLDQTLNTQLDLLMILMRTSDIEVTTFDWSTFAKQIKEIVNLTLEFSEESWYPFGNGDYQVDSMFATLKAVLPACTIPLKDSLDKAEELKNMSDEAESTVSERDSVLERSVQHRELRRCINRETIYTIKKDFKRLQYETQPKGFLEFTQEVSKVCAQLLKQVDKVQGAQLDHSGGLMMSFLANYLKLWYFLPEFKPIILLRLKALSQTQLLFSLLRFIPTIRLQFLLSGGFKLQELNSEEHLSQLENMHDILLYQQKYNRIRREMKDLNDLVQQGRLPGLREKIETSLTEMMVSIPKTEGKDRTTVDLQKILKVIGSMSGYDSIDPFFSRTDLIDEVADLLVYNLLLEQARDGGSFEKLSKMKWEELKEPEGLSDYVTDVCNSAKTITGHVLKLGAVIGLEQKQIEKINTSVVKFYLNSLVDVYGSVRRITPQAKSQMTLDILSILENCKRLTKEGLKDLEDYVIGFFKHVEYDEPTALRNLVEGLQHYQLRILKNFYFYAGVKDLGTRKVGFSSNSLVVKTEKLVTLFELARSCLITMLDDEKVIAANDYSPTLVEMILSANDKAKQLIASGPQMLQPSGN